MIDGPIWLTHRGSVGRCSRGGEVHILDDDGADVPADTDGLVDLDAPAVGRFHDGDLPDATQAAYQDDRFTLGEVGHLDDGGYLYLTGRSSDMVISGCVNLCPAETEDLLAEHPDGADAAGFGIPDADLVEIMAAAAVPAARASLGLDVLLAWLRPRIAVHKLPQRILTVERLPRSEAGKILRRDPSLHLRPVGDGP